MGERSEMVSHVQHSLYTRMTSLNKAFHQALYTVCDNEFYLTNCNGVFIGPQETRGLSLCGVGGGL